MKILGVIPARYKSSRFPGKPLAHICGKPMIWWVYQQAMKSTKLNEVVIATDDVRIYDECKGLNLNVEMTSDMHPTGTDRIAELAEKITADIYVNVQGDEPLIEPDIIDKVIEPFFYNENILMSSLMSVIDKKDVNNPNIVKVVVNNDNFGLLLSRSAIPYQKVVIPEYNYYRQLGIFGFKPEALRFFKNTPQGMLEKSEEIETLRFIENMKPVKFSVVDTISIGVDIKEDIEIVENILKMRGF